MVEDYPKTCPRCGDHIQEGDKFCENCGAAILPPAPQAERVVPEPTAASHAPPPTGGSRTLVWVAGVGVLAVLLVVVGALAATVFGVGLGPLGEIGSGPAARQGGVPANGNPQGQPPADPGPPRTSSEGATPASSFSPDSPPDPAFDLLLPTLRERTDAPIMLPAELPNELENVAVDDGLQGDSYGMLFLATPPDDLVETFVRYKTVAYLRVVPESEAAPDRYFAPTNVEEVSLPDGTGAKLRYMQPTKGGGTYGPYWEGTFDKDGHAYTLSTISDEYGKDVIEQALASMVPVSDSVSGNVATTIPQPQATTSGTTPQPSAGNGQSEEQQIERFVQLYYTAVAFEDWERTYSYLDPASQAEFTEDEWVSVQRARVAANDPPALESTEARNIREVENGFSVTALLDYVDGTQETVEIEVSYENGRYERHLTEEEISYLRDLAGSGTQS